MKETSGEDCTRKLLVVSCLGGADDVDANGDDVEDDNVGDSFSLIFFVNSRI